MQQRAFNTREVLQLPGVGSMPADTFGWDTVSVVPVADMNRAIRTAGCSPQYFAHDFDADSSIAGCFDAWRIAAGGDGRLLHMALPLRKVEVVVQGRKIAIDEATLKVEVRLHFLPHQPENLALDARVLLHLLMVCPTPVNEHVPAACVIDAEFPQGDPGMVPRRLLMDGVQQWLIEHIGEFNHVFASVNLYRSGAEEAFPWLKPSYVSYVYVDRNGPDDSLFGILCQTENRSPDHLIEQLSPVAVPDGADCGYLISAERMMQEMIAPGISHAFKGVLPKHLDISADGKQLKLKKAVRLQKVEHDGKSYDPELQLLDIKLNNTELVLEAQTKTRVSPGIYSMCRNIGYYHVGLLHNRAGKKTLGYRESRDPVSHNWTQKSQAVKIIGWIIDALVALGAIVLTVLSAGAAAYPAILIATLLLGAGALTMKTIEAVHNDDGPPLDLLLLNATDAISWSNGSDFELTHAALNGALQLGGRFRSETLPLRNNFRAPGVNKRPVV